jgi:N-ethylmaleimide reductase
MTSEPAGGSGRRSLFDPVRLGGRDLPSRIVMGPMTRSRAQASGVPGPDSAAYYAQRASAAVIITEGTQPSLVGQGYPATPGLHTDEQVASWRPVTRAVHDAGGRIWVQLMHAGRIGHAELTGLRPLAPSPVRPAGTAVTPGGRRPAYQTPREMSRSEIIRTIDDFAAAGERALSAGFDGVELHAANGYLLHQFLASGTNHRGDEYGSDRTRFVLDVVEAVAGAVGHDRLGLRISPGSPVNDMLESDVEKVYHQLLTRLPGRRLGYLHVTGVAVDTDLAVALRRDWPGALIVAPGSTGPGPAGPLPADGGRAAAQAWLDAGADLITFGRAFLANGDLPERLRTGQPLNLPDASTYYGSGRQGHLDYRTRSNGDSARR